MERKSGQDLIQMIKSNMGKLCGGLIGLVTAILILQIGVFKTFLLLFFTLFGLVIGANWERIKEISIRVISKLLPSKFR